MNHFSVITVVMLFSQATSVVQAANGQADLVQPLNGGAMAFSESVVAGVVAAILLGGFNWIIKSVWLAHISPWWENLTYSDARVDGIWETKLITDLDSDYREVAKIKQVGHRVAGTIECTNGVDRGNAYEFIGTIRNTILSAYYWNTDKTALDSGSFSLRLESNGERLRGYTSYYFDIDHSLKSREYCWTRHRVVNHETKQIILNAGKPGVLTSIASLSPNEGQEPNAP
ncbi:MAG: hypothetical protein Q7J58_19360 [Hydrogenophaga sp.]|uniref:hypothetical protein n=1 Tax=Hydrogenophaga sp. TaxID=1904254 RepID=UPI00271D08FC|nr:hypothetical protein [Hydrogenophaga sp.]MDO9571513.1 hypothetical protein [Hydrogenophaga sp.]MDP3374984.1 hypothetical protein [Hydrogenophaga sp.]